MHPRRLTPKPIQADQSLINSESQLAVHYEDSPIRLVVMIGAAGLTTYLIKSNTDAFPSIVATLFLCAISYVDFKVQKFIKRAHAIHCSLHQRVRKLLVRQDENFDSEINEIRGDHRDSVEFDYDCVWLVIGWTSPIVASAIILATAFGWLEFRRSHNAAPSAQRQAALGTPDYGRYLPDNPGAAR